MPAFDLNQFESDDIKGFKILERQDPNLYSDWISIINIPRYDELHVSVNPNDFSAIVTITVGTKRYVFTNTDTMFKGNDITGWGANDIYSLIQSINTNGNY